MSDDRTIHIGVRVTDQDDPVAGSVEMVCAECDEPTWVAPSGLQIIEADRSILVCLDCAFELMDATDDGYEVRPLRPEQLVELLEEQARRSRN